MTGVRIASNLNLWLSTRRLLSLHAGRSLCLDCPRTWPALEVSPRYSRDACALVSAWKCNTLDCNRGCSHRNTAATHQCSIYNTWKLRGYVTRKMPF